MLPLLRGLSNSVKVFFGSCHVPLCRVVGDAALNTNNGILSISYGGLRCKNESSNPSKRCVVHVQIDPLMIWIDGASEMIRSNSSALVTQKI